MSYFEKNPVDSYRYLKGKIPFLRENLSKFLNNYHGTTKSADFWWCVAGEYALYAEHFSKLSINDERLFFELQRHSKSFNVARDLSEIVLNLIARDVISGVSKEALINSKGRFHESSCLFTDEEKHFQVEPLEHNQDLSIPFDKITKFLNFPRRFLLKLRNFFGGRSADSSNKHKINKMLVENEEIRRFFQFLELVLPDSLLNNFPLWFVSLGDLIVGRRHKWVTYFGLELSIYQIILIACSYEKFGYKNIKIIVHGGVIGEAGIWELFRFSLSQDFILSIEDRNLKLYKKSVSGRGAGILYCPAQLPWVCGFFSLDVWRDIIKAHEATIALLRGGVNKGKNIKIRYKDFKYLDGYSGRHLIDDNFINIENERFEDSYMKYSTIVSIPYGTIAAKCLASNIDCLVYHRAYVPTDLHSYNYISNLPGVHTDLDKYLSELSNLIDGL